MAISDESNLFDREEILSGPASNRRAKVLLFAIESRTAHLKDKSRRFSSSYHSLRADDEREEAFLDALATGRHPALLPTIQDLERHVLHWLPLVSEVDINLRAALARALGQKYEFTYSAIPGIRKALGLDEEAVRQEYRRLYDAELSALYLAKPNLISRLRWLLAGLAKAMESLPPFWVAFALTLPIGPGLLAVPIAVAEIGAIPGIVLLIIFGIINALTVASLAETVARSGTTRFGIGYIGQIVSEYIGDAGSLLLTATLAINNVLILIAFYIGVAGTLEQATGLSSTVWLGLLFIIVLFFLSRKTLNTTVASALIISFIKIALVIAIPVLSLPYINLANFQHMNVPFVGGQPFKPSVLQLIFGVMLANYCSHLLVANYGQVVIRRDPSARTWIWGCVAGVGLTMLVSCAWIIAFNGAIPAIILAQETGTAVTALARYVGPIINWLGAVFVILSVGLACIHISLGSFFLVRERLPRVPKSRSGKRLNFFISISPVVVVFLISEWMAISGLGSFTRLLSIVGGLALPLLAGIFPLLLLAVTRRKGDFVPGTVIKFIGHPVVLVGLYLLFLGSIFLYGIFIWENLLERVISIVLGVIIFALTFVILRRKMFKARVVVELREDLSPGSESVFNITAGGKPLETEVMLDFKEYEKLYHCFGGAISNFHLLHKARFSLPATGARELKVWVHQITPEWASVGLPTSVRVKRESELHWLPLELSDGQVLVDFNGQACQLEISLVDPSTA